MAEQGWLRPAYKREQYDRLRAVVNSVLDDLKGACSFWACPGPEAPFTPMATCRVCAAQMDLRAALDGKPLPSEEQR